MPHTQLNSRSIKNVNVKTKTFKISVENLGSYILGFGVGQAREFFKLK